MQGEWTQERLEALGREWQERLQLLDWAIEWRLVTPDETGGDWAICTRHSTNKRRAIIKVADTGLFSSPPDPSGEVEASIVHELLHLHLWPMHDALTRVAVCGGSLVKPLLDMARDEFEEAQERAIYHISLALVAAKRGGEHGPQGGVPPPGAQGPEADGPVEAAGPAPADNGPDPQDPHPEAAEPAAT